MRKLTVLLALALVSSCDPAPTQTNVSGSKQGKDFAVQSAKTLADVAAPKLPQRISPNITWTKAHSTGGTFILSYVVYHTADELYPIVEQMQTIGFNESKNRLCGQPDSKRSLDLGVVWEYEFVSSDLKPLYSYSVDKDDCNVPTDRSPGAQTHF